MEQVNKETIFDEILNIELSNKLAPFSDIIIRFEALKNTNISYKDLGAGQEFIEAEQKKNEICSKIISLNEHIIQMITLRYDDETLNKNVERFSNGIIIKELNEVIEKIKDLSENIHNQQYPNQRHNILLKLKTSVNTASETIYKIDRDIKLHDFFHIYSSMQNEQGVNYISLSKEYFNEINKIYNDVKKTQEKALIDANKIDFSNLARKNKTHEIRWFIATIAITFITLCLIIYAFNLNIEFKDYFKFLNESGLKTTDLNYSTYIIPNIFKRILLITFPFIFLKVALNKYNIERNLRIIYENRIAVLNKYMDFQPADMSNTDAINQFRIEVMRYIFSDPKTGYIKESSQSDLNINPIMNIFDKFTK